MARAAVLRMKALAITDRNSLAGIVRAHQRAKEAGIRLIVGCRLDLTDGPSVLVYPTSRAGYSRLTRLLTMGKGRAGKGKCELYWPDLAAASEDLIGILCTRSHRSKPAPPESGFRRPRLCRPDVDAPSQRRRPAAHHHRHRRALSACPAVATNDVLYHAPGRHILQDVLTCIREGCTIDELGYRRERSTVTASSIARRNDPPVRPPSRTPSPARRRSPIVAGSVWTNSATSIRMRFTSPA